MYRTVNEYYRERFGCKVYKLSLDGGFTCPNRDGTCGTGGCIFCAGDGSGAFSEPCNEDILLQIQRAKERVKAKNKGGKYIAYFQSFTGTYAPVDRLRELFFAAIKPDDIVGIAIGTRPDCLPDPVIDLLNELNQIKPVSIELGLQTIHEKTASFIRRGYNTSVYYDAVKRLKSKGIEVVTHIILGLPLENISHAVETTVQAVKAGTDGVKFHLLHVLKGTDLEKEYRLGKVKVLSLEDYAEWLKACISVLPPAVIVHRITGDGAKKDLIAPLWSADKKRVLNALRRELNNI